MKGLQIFVCKKNNINITMTPRQLEVLQYIKNSRIKNGFSPTMKEIGDYLGLSKVTIFEHIHALKKKKLLLCNGKNKARSLYVNDEFVFIEDKELRLLEILDVSVDYIEKLENKILNLGANLPKVKEYEKTIGELIAIMINKEKNIKRIKELKECFKTEFII